MYGQGVGKKPPYISVFTCLPRLYLIGAWLVISAVGRRTAGLDSEEYAADRC